jgi:hypothetical protein
MNPVRNCITSNNTLNLVRNSIIGQDSTKGKISNGMNRRDFLKATGPPAAGIILTGAASLAMPRCTAGAKQLTAAPQAQTKPNFVFILIDDMGWSDVGCYGNQFHETPNIDRLAGQGMRFTDAYAACPVCSPTRASIIAGQYPACSCLWNR